MFISILCSLFLADQAHLCEDLLVYRLYYVLHWLHFLFDETFELVTMLCADTIETWGTYDLFLESL